MTKIIIALVLLSSVLCCGLMLFKMLTQTQESTRPARAIKLAITGILAYISDTIGVGSFAVNIALCKALKLFSDRQIPAVINTAQVIPGAIESVIFMQKVKVDVTTLVILTIATCCGGVLGGLIASRLRARMVQLIMIIAFSAIVLLLLANMLSILPTGSGTLTALSGWRLWLGSFGLLLAGVLVAFGVGLFAVIEAVLFLLGMSPLVAFPIMTTAGALQQPLTASTFLLLGKVPLKPVLIIAVFGVIGVLIGVKLLSVMTFGELHLLLVLILLFNIFVLTRNFLRKAKQG